MGHRQGARSPLAVGLVLLFLAPAVFAGKCTTGCHGMQHGKSYKEGHTYVYEFEGQAVTSAIEGQNASPVSLKATVELSVKPDCLHQLRLKNVKLNGAAVTGPEVEKHAVQFNYHNGHIDTEICTEPGDTPASLNIKRAVVSMFQSAVMQESGTAYHQETDVFGGCPTSFAFQKDGEQVLVRKERNLAQCNHRETINQGLISATFDANADVKSSPLLDATQGVQQRYRQGVLTKATSHETYSYVPFKNGANGAKTTVETSLTLKTDRADAPAAPVSEPKSLVFEAPPSATPAKSSAEHLGNALKAVKTEETSGSGHYAAGKFAELVKAMRATNQNDILAVYRKVQSDPSDKKLFLDALFHAGTADAVQVASSLIRNREISEIHALLFYANLALVGQVSLPSVTAAMSLLDQPNLPRVGYLGIGKIIGRFCQSNPCEGVPEVKEAIHKLREKVANGKAKTRDQENTIVTALKALGNAKYMDDGTLQKLASIAADKNARNRLRVAAIEALPGKCSMKWKDPLFKVLADREEDSEVRIKTYLSLVQCACPHVANQLKDILDKETVNQVGSFVQSHLRHLRATTDPAKQEAKKQLGQIKPRTKFPEDFRKFSFNNEFSYHVDSLGMGSVVESNVIYSQNSFVPRSANLNLTTEIFGRSFNFLELSTRVENLDRLIEHYFGPRGVVNAFAEEVDAEAAHKKVSPFTKYIKDRYAKITRGKREVKQGELDRFAKNVKLRGTEVDEDLDVDLSMRLFGVELGYFSYQGSDKLMDPLRIVDEIFDYLEKGAQRVKDFDYDIQNHLYFLDGELTYPTGLGAPLGLSVTGSSVVHLKASGKLDIGAIIHDPKNANFRVAVEPNASIQLVGSMAVKSFGVESGLKVLGNLHTSTGTDVTVSVLNGKGVDVNFGMPLKNQELISITSEVLLSSGPKGESSVALNVPKGKEYSECFGQLTPFLGVTICEQMVLPYEKPEEVQNRPFFPLSGPAKLKISIENTDVSSYHLKVHYNDRDPKSRSFEILLDTPNSKTNRKLSFLVEAGLEPDKFARISLDSPIRKALVEAILKNSQEERSITLKALNDHMEYFFRAGLTAAGSKYKPILEYRVPEHVEKLTSAKAREQQYNVEGVVDVKDFEGGKKFVFSKVALVAASRKLLSLDGTVVSTPDKAQVDMKVGYADESLALKLDGKRHAERNYEVALSAVPSRDPNIGFNLKWKWNRSPTELDHKLVFTHGADLDSEVNRVSLDQNLVYKLDPKDFALATSNKLTYPALNVLLKLEGKLTPKSVDADLEVKYEKFKMGTELSAKANTEKPGDYEVELEAELLQNSIELKAKRTILDSHKSKFKNSLEISPGGKYEADAVVVYDVSKSNTNVQADGDLNLNGKKVQFGTGLEMNPQVLNGRALVTLDGTKYVDFNLRVRRTPNPNGSVNLNLKNYLASNGQFSYQAGKGNGNLVIDMPKINRKIKATGDLAVAGTQHTANAELLYDADNDPNKRIKFSTVSDITKTSFDSKNIVEFLAHKLEVNGNGKMQGTFANGQIAGDVQVTLPNGRHIGYKLKRISAKRGDSYDLSVDNELVDAKSKGGESRRFTYKGEAKDFNTKTGSVNAHAQFNYVDFDGKDVVLNYKVKAVPQPDNHELHAQLDVSGSRVPKPFKFEFERAHGPKESTFKGKSSLGNDFSLQANAKTTCGDSGSDKPITLDFDVDLKLPSEKLTNLKIQHSGSLLKPTAEKKTSEVSSSTSMAYNDKKPIKLEVYGKHASSADGYEKLEGNGKLTLTVMNKPPLTVGGSYKYDNADAKKKASHTLNVNYGDSEATVASDAEYLPDLSYLDLHARSTLPLESLKKLNLQLKHQRANEGRNRKTEYTLTADDAKYSGVTEIQLDETAKMFHVALNSPNVNGEVLLESPKHGEYKGDWKLHTPKGYVVADVLVNLESIDNFVINANFDSDKVTPPKIHAEIANSPAPKNGRRIVITVTSDGQNIVTGSTNYKMRNEDGKVIVEGSGNVKVGENVKSSSFKYTRKELTNEADGEVGVTMILNANFGPSAIVGELKLSNKEVHVFNSYCEQNKDCAHFKLQSTLDTDHKTHLKHQATLEVDLKKFNVPAQFGLKSNTEYKGVTFDHIGSLYLHSSKDKSEYSYQAYVHTKDAAIVLTLPTREIALILTGDLPKTKQTGAYRLEASFYLDRKNKPNEKTSLAANGDVNVERTSLSLTGEAKFSYPNQPKDMLLRGRLHSSTEYPLDLTLDVDVFAKKSQKISVSSKIHRQQIEGGWNATNVVEINSRGQDLKLDLKSHLAISANQFGFGSLFTYNDVNQKPRTLGSLFSVDFQGIYFLATLPDKDLVRSTTQMQLAKEPRKIYSELSFLGYKPIVSDLETDGLGFKYQLYGQEQPNNKLTANGQVVIGQLAEIHANTIMDGQKKELFHGLVHLDEGKFLKPDFGFNKDNVVETIDYIKEHGNRLVRQVNQLSGAISDEAQREIKDLVEHLRKAQPNVKPLLEYYQTELGKIKKELHADETIKEIQATLNKYFGAFIATVTEAVKQFIEQMHEAHKHYMEALSKILETIKSVYPTVKQSFLNIMHSLLGVFDAFGNLLVAYLKGILTILNEHQKDLKDILGVVSEYCQDIAKILLRSLSQVKQDSEEFLKLLVNQLKALPIFETIKEKYNEILNFQLPAVVTESLEDVCKVVKAVLPTKELRDFVDVVCHYTMKLAKREKIDDPAEIKKIYSHAVNAIRSLISLARSQVTADFTGFPEAKLPIDLSLLSKVPRIGTLSVSVFNLIRNRDLPSPQDLYYAYRPTLRASDIVPPFSMTGTVTDGGHLFTFDGRHFGMSGNCHYILAQDMRDGNFSVVANFNNGILNSVTVTEPKESITMKADGNILVNNKPSDYPDSTKSMDVFLIPPFANVKSKYGVRVACTTSQPMVCVVRVSGFYLGKVRGLLGDGNNEPYDDFTLPNGQITENALDFANAYKLKGDCPVATAVAQAPRAPSCTEYFSGQTSTLKSCFNYVNPQNYRDACDQAVSSSTKGAACLVAGAYVAACYEKRVFVNLPEACTSCKVSGNDVALGDTFSVKIPKKEADVIFVVEQETKNEKLFKEGVLPLMNELREEFKQHGITDVHIGLIGFGEKMKYPQHYTSGGKQNIEGDVKNMVFEEKDHIMTLQEAKEGDAEDKLNYLHQRMDVELGTFKLTDAYEEAIRYPFRAGAAKAVIGIIATPCEKSPLPLSLQNLRVILGQKIYRDLGLTYYHVTSNELQVSDKTQKNIVGYDAENVYTFGDSKKKPLAGNADMKSNLGMPVKDVCADFAIGSGGAAFSSDNFLEAKPNQKKQFIQVAARRIVEGLTSIELEEDCRCEQQYGITGRAHCKIVSRKEKEPLAKHRKTRS